MKVYHYTSDHLRTKHPGNNVYKQGQPLLAVSWFDRNRVIFALLEPLPKEWVEDPIWQRFMFNSGPLLLEIDIEPDTDRAFVVDQALTRDTQETDQYLVSKIPLKDFLEQREELGYRLPEIIIEGDIPAEKVKVACNQPLIEEELENLRRYGDSYVRQRIIDLRRIHSGLEEWYTTYIDRHHEFKGGLSDEIRWRMGRARERIFG